MMRSAGEVDRWPDLSAPSRSDEGQTRIVADVGQLLSGFDSRPDLHGLSPLVEGSSLAPAGHSPHRPGDPRLRAAARPAEAVGCGAPAVMQPWLKKPGKRPPPPPPRGPGERPGRPPRPPRTSAGRSSRRARPPKSMPPNFAPAIRPPKSMPPNFARPLRPPKSMPPNSADPLRPPNRSGETPRRLLRRPNRSGETPRRPLRRPNRSGETPRHLFRRLKLLGRNSADGFSAAEIVAAKLRGGLFGRRNR